ncbi:phospholipase D delta [Eucalyptus grandis]|uniref:phospholipase D delta n=1 Tax=Eucalyptus grandis TaxID=71139 RepID=UPI00192EB5FE|nr:phospholipase D delta [Eucalyptus grandis]
MENLPPGHGAYLHGDLDLHIISASNLPTMDMVSGRLRRCLSACARPSRSSDLAPASPLRDPCVHDARCHKKVITSDPYVTVRVPHATIARTRILHNMQNPWWDQRFRIPLAHFAVDLEFRVKDSNLFCAQLIGTVNISAREIKSGEDISGSFPLRGPSAKPNSRLQLKLKFTSVENNAVYQHSIAGDPDHLGVRHTYFPLRKGCSVRLYQDAHVVDGMSPGIELESDAGGVYRHEKCWEDICHAISEAHHLIYIVGWSVSYNIKLIRERTQTRRMPLGGDLTLGELLKYKSREGVRVLLLIWDDKTSRDKHFINKEGVMQTRDEETRDFFKNSSVNCVLVPRNARGKLGYIKQQVVGSMFTHHQKCILVDTQALGNHRKITAFIGGIDLCDGRYDTPEHRLFRDLDTVFKDDFHNPTFPAGMKAPRQPWHDLHCRIEGPAAYDVLMNFEQRWRKATRWFSKGKKNRHDDSLLKIGRISWILSPTSTESHDSTSLTKDDHHDRITVVPEDNPDLYVSKEDDHNNWHVQIFRSIDSGSVKGFPTKRKDIAEKQNLIVTKDAVVDRSIQTAYVQAIRSAQHFVYIENQHFLGSSYAWPSNNDAGADNLIPMELALKIASKIRAKQRFAVYIVIPMWPEGDPKSATIQQILFWQNQTMQMMYKVVASQLKQMALGDSHPQDYLNFYCLGKREDNSGQPSPDDAVSESYKSGRFMINVHAKGMVVDDEYVLLGSANINQRSLAGTKDTEIAMGAYQPHHTWAQKKRHPFGQVLGYRMSLWIEHFGGVEECFIEAGSLECVKRVNKIAENNWKSYKEQGSLQGHLLWYPIQVDRDGRVGPLPGSEEFPDVCGKVVGAHSTTIPDVLTT